MFFLWLFAALLSCMATDSHAQIIYRQGRPPSGSLPAVPLAKVAAIAPAISAVVLPSIDLDAIRREDARNDQDKLRPWRFAIPHAVDLHPGNSGYWTPLANGDRIWRLELHSPGARTLNVIFNRFHLAEGAEVYLYNSDRSEVLGPFTEQNNLPGGTLATAPVSGDILVVEYLEPRAAAGTEPISIGQVAHGYRALNAVADYGNSSYCERNTVCPLGDGSRCQIKSEVMITTGGKALCSGTLLNNTSKDGAPIVLTANHCSEGGSKPADWVFIFNWESPTCNPTTNASMSQSISGATLLAHDTISDFYLVKLSGKPPAAYNAFYAGWDATGTTPKTETGIHHPSGDIKKISFDRDPAKRSGTFWAVGWDEGVTERGSSGSGLFDQEGRVIGQLQGGLSRCWTFEQSLDDDDLYGRLDVSFGKGASTYLDPGKTGLKKMDGMGNGSCAESAVAAKFRVSAESDCNGAVTFADESRNATAWNWNFGDGQTSTAQNPTHTYAGSGTFSVTLTATGAGGATSTMAKDVYASNVGGIVAAGDSVCPGKPAQLSADAGKGNIVHWYAAASGGSSLATGMTFATPALNATATYYADAVEDKPIERVGPANNAFGAGGYYSAKAEQGLNFVWHFQGTLKSVKVYANSSGSRTIEVDSGNNVKVLSKTVSVPKGESRVQLDFSLAPGYYVIKLAKGSLMDLYRNTTGAYPYFIANKVDMINGTDDVGDGYFYFYDWELIEGKVCKAPRVAVTAAADAAKCQTGVAVHPNGPFEVYPLLSDGYFFVNPMRDGEMEVMSPSGGTITKVSVRAGTHAVDLRGLGEGSYILRFAAFPGIGARERACRIMIVK